MRGGPGSGIVDGVRVDAASAAFQRFADALNRARDPAALRAAVTDDIRIDRHTPGERGAAPILESFAGLAEVERWVARTPPVVQFALAGAAWLEPAGGDADADGERWAIEYAYRADAFHHGGIWIARLAGDGRIAVLAHHPFALRDPPPGSPGAPHAHGGAGHSHGG